jgi:glycosyltransferase involved in cell wall biosynthesis
VRVLLITHRFPPASSAGTEVYAAELGVQLAKLGCQVEVFTAEKDVGRRDLSLHRREHRGLVVHELVQNLYLERFEQTWDRPEVDRVFAEVLERVRPDVVHVHHLLYLSVGLLDVARERGVPVVMTLHDFWLECPRFGQLVHADGSLCQRVEAERCGTCLPSLGWRQSNLARRVGRALAGVHALTGVDLAGAARRAATKTSEDSAWQAPPADEAQVYAQAVKVRDAALRERVLPRVQRFISPSHFLAGRMIAWGIPAERIEVLPSGVDRANFADRERVPRTGPLRVRFLGTQVPLKGAHVLLEAWGLLSESRRAQGTLTLNGPDGFQPAYVAKLRALADRVGATLGGALDREGVARALAETDLLVVPSQWFENRPLIVLEALATGTPLCVSDLGGQIELVEEGDAGWRFPFDDPAALAARLDGLLADPTPLDGLPFAGAGALLPGWDTVAQAHLDRYRKLLA